MLGQSVAVSDGFDERPLDMGQPSSHTVRLLADSQLCSLQGFLRRVFSSTHLSKERPLNGLSKVSIPTKSDVHRLPRTLLDPQPTQRSG